MNTRFLKNCVFTKLEQCGLWAGRVILGTAKSREVVYFGRPDDVGVHELDNTVSSIVEIKSSQNLLVPNAAKEVCERYKKEVCERYKKAFDDQVQKRSEERSLEWSRIGHPLAQTLGYMIDNAAPYGALTSASKAYFVRLVRKTDSNGSNDSEVQVEITKAWKTCESNYLRAWAFFSRVANRDSGSLRGDNLKEEIQQEWLGTLHPFASATDATARCRWYFE